MRGKEHAVTGLLRDAVRLCVVVCEPRGHESVCEPSGSEGHVLRLYDVSVAADEYRDPVHQHRHGVVRVENRFPGSGGVGGVHEPGGGVDGDAAVQAVFPV